MIKSIDPRPLLRLRRHLIRQIPPWEDILRGSLMRYRFRCHYVRCRCRHPTQDLRHGPYWYLVVHRSKGNRKAYAIADSQLSRVRKGRKAYETLWKNLVKITEINVQLLKAREQGGRHG